MNKLTTLFYALSFVGLLSISVQAQTKSPETLTSVSSWVNQDGSIFTINSVDGYTGQLTGTYVNKAPGYGCQNTPYNVTGYVYGNAITFTVNWDNSTQSCSSITAWTGFYYNGTISTQWQLVVNGTTTPTQILTGSDTFTYYSKVTISSLKK